MRATVHHSEDIDSVDAVAEVLADAAAQWGDAVPQAGLLIASIEHDFATIQGAIMAKWPELELIGGTGDGEISSIAGATDDSVALMLFGSDRIAFRAGVGYDVIGKPKQAIRQALATARAGEAEPPRLCVIVPEGWGIDIQSVLREIQDELGPQTLVVGGLTTEAGHDRPTKQAFKGETLQHALTVLLFYGPLKVSTAVHSGMRPVGQRRRVTRADGPFVQEIDDRPARDLWIEVFGQHSIFYPLAVFPEADEQFYIAATPYVNDEGAAYFWNPIPQGSMVQLADVTQDELLAASTEVCDEVVSDFGPGRPDAALVFSCAGRKAMLGTRTGEEIDLLRERLAIDIPFIGYYTSGELCPLRGQRTTRDHGFTFVTVLLAEA